MKKSALGRGLGALLNDVDHLNINRGGSPDEATLASISEVSIDLIEVNPFQPRTSFHQDAIEELAQSIKSYGLIQPITVRAVESGNYQIISGERRVRAAKRAGLTHIPAYIRRADDNEMLEMALVENIQRQDLDAIEIALSYQRLIEEVGLTQEEMAERVGKKRATVTNYIRLLKLPAEIQLLLRAEKISMGHARALLSLKSTEEQLELCGEIIEEELSVRAVEEKIRAINAKDKEDTEEERDSYDDFDEEEEDLEEVFIEMLEFLGKHFNNNISLRFKPKKDLNDTDRGGSITIKFANRAEVESLVKAVENSNL